MRRRRGQVGRPVQGLFAAFTSIFSLRTMTGIDALSVLRNSNFGPIHEEVLDDVPFFALDLLKAASRHKDRF